MTSESYCCMLSPLISVMIYGYNDISTYCVSVMRWVSFAFHLIALRSALCSFDVPIGKSNLTSNQESLSHAYNSCCFRSVHCHEDSECREDDSACVNGICDCLPGLVKLSDDTCLGKYTLYCFTLENHSTCTAKWKYQTCLQSTIYNSVNISVKIPRSSICAVMLQDPRRDVTVFAV